MQRFSLLFGLVALTVTLGLLWRTEDPRQPLSVAELENELPGHLEHLLSEMPGEERSRVLRELKKAQTDAEHTAKIRIIQLTEGTDTNRPFLFPTDQMYRQIPQFDSPVQRK